MKKFAITAVAAAAVLGAGAAHAYTSGTFANGFVVPNVVHNADGSGTVVGIISRSAGPVYWTFFNEDSGHETDGCFEVTNNDFTPFNWSQESGLGYTGKRGYLLFVTGNTSSSKCYVDVAIPSTASYGLISGSAFFVDPVNKDVAFTPVIDGPVALAAGRNLNNLNETSLTKVDGALQVPANNTSKMVSARYYIDNATGGNDTNIFVWSTGSQKGTHTVFMYNDKQESRSVNFKLDHTELDAFNPETIPGRPADYLDGFINWTPTLKDGAGTAVGGSVFVYSVISAPALGAVQSILGAHN
ncbi:hypothetical protein [Ottowia oryzae]